MGVYVIHCWCIIGNSVETDGIAFRSFWANQRPASGWGVRRFPAHIKTTGLLVGKFVRDSKSYKMKEGSTFNYFLWLRYDGRPFTLLGDPASTGTLWRKGVLSNKQLFCLRLSINPHRFPASAAKSTSGKQWDLWRRVSFAAVIKISSLGS